MKTADWARTSNCTVAGPITEGSSGRAVVCRAALILFSCVCFGAGENLAKAADAPFHPIEFSGTTMCTITYKVLVNELPSAVDRSQVQNRIDRLLETVNDQMSTYRSNSELSRFNRYRGTDWFDVSSDTAKVVVAALEIGDLSNGVFDISVGPLVDLWSFGPAARRRHLPSDESIEQALARVGYRRIHARTSPPAIRKEIPDISLDLSAIAKGFAVDQIAEYLNDLEASGYLVEIGGETRTRGVKSSGLNWTIGIEKPTELTRSLYHSVEMADAAMATSGDYRNYFEYEGKRYSHTIDPRTGRPIAFGLASASVVADSCMLADALATAIMVLGAEDGYRWAVDRKLPALLLIRSPRGFTERATPLFQEQFCREPRPVAPTFVLTFSIFVVALIAMAVGVIFSNRRLRGSCGGDSPLRDEEGNLLCDACTTPSEVCPAAKQRGESHIEPP